MSIQFKELLDAAGTQDEPQRLLFLFAQIEKQDSKKHKQRQHGSVVPLMCVDKLPAELTDFTGLAAEADQVSAGWDFVLAAGLSGTGGQPPSTDDAEPHLNKMANDLMMGADLSRYVIFDRQGNPVSMQAN
ncbi:ribonucleotide reductase subunit alpha [Pontibacterium sp.]|uniref:ribonucleotide reductase subunit alpha n=1 Tax=Pontibacterium sp. TaxID=2036026 RepID=UPI00356AA896